MGTATQFVAIVGGAFDPVHLGHLSLAEDTFKELNLDEIWFVPTAQSPLKNHDVELNAAGRLKLLEAALEPFPPFKVDSTEIERGGVSYTIDTVRRFNEAYPDIEFSWIIGGDQVAQLNLWREIDELAKRVRFVVVSRPGFEVDAARIPALTGFRISEVTSRWLDISSSDIRSRITEGKPVNDLLPKAVADLIVHNNFYKD